MPANVGFGTGHAVVALANALGWKLGNCPRDFLSVSYGGKQVVFEDSETKSVARYFFGFGTAGALAQADEFLSRRCRAFVPTDSCFLVWDLPGFQSAEEVYLKIGFGQHESWKKVVPYE